MKAALRTASQSYEWCLALTDSIASWLSQLSDPAHPGQVRYCAKGSLLEPSADAGLGATCLAMKVSCQIGIWEHLDAGLRSAWIAHIRSFQRPSTGYFEDRAVLSVADRKANWSWPMRWLARLARAARMPLPSFAVADSARKVDASGKRDMAVRRAETRQAAAALKAAGAAPEYPIPGVPANRAGVLEYLQRLPWYWNPWHAASHTSYLVFALQLNADVFGQLEPLQTLTPVILDYLDQLQDPETGSWFKTSWLPRPVPPNQQVNAAMKILTAYHLLQQPVRWPELLIDLCLDSSDLRDACHSVDAVFVLHECVRLTSHRQSEVERFALRAIQLTKRHRKQDGAFSFFPDRANTTYYGVPVSRGLAESDVQGTHLLVWAITLCAGLLGFVSELGWRLPVT